MSAMTIAIINECHDQGCREQPMRKTWSNWDMSACLGHERVPGHERVASVECRSAEGNAGTNGMHMKNQ